MKKLLVLLFMCCCLLGSLFSATERLYQTISTYYRVYSTVSEEYTEEIAAKMEACLALFNDIFHFDLSRLETKLKVVIYSDQTGFDAYLSRLLGKTRSDFVYIHYADLTKSELVGYRLDDEDTFNTLLIHQGLIQFLKAFSPTAPMWMQEGIAANVESSIYNEETNSFTLEKSLAWLETLKKIIRGEGEGPYLTVLELITLSKESAISQINTFYPEAWGLVYFLMNSEKKAYNRILTDSICLLDQELSMAENSLVIKNKVFSWVRSDVLEQDFVAFIQALKTFQDHIEDGIEYYGLKDYINAAKSFSAARDLRPTDYFAYYYQGLIAYSNKEYYNAEQAYLQALTLGADPGLTNYALGVNAYADNEFDTAKTYLSRALDADSEKYGEKVQEILDRIEAENLFVDGEIYVAPPDLDGVEGTDNGAGEDAGDTTDGTDTTDTTDGTGSDTTDGTIDTPPPGDATGDGVEPAGGTDTADPAADGTAAGDESDASVSTPEVTTGDEDGSDALIDDAP